MSTRLRTVLGILAGIAVAIGVIAMVEAIGRGAHPTPAAEGADERYFMTLPAAALLYPLVGWIIGTYVGGIVAGSIARARVALSAGVVGAFVLANVAWLMMIMPHPTWMVLAAILTIPLAAWFAARTTAKGLARGAAAAEARTSGSGAA